MSDGKRSELVSSAAEFLSSFARFQRVFEFLFVICGALISGIGGLIDVELVQYAGLAMVFIGGSVLLLLKKDVASVFKTADEAITKSSSDEAEITRLSSNFSSLETASNTQDKRRRSRLLAHTQSLEVIEGAVVNDADVALAAQQLLKRTFSLLRDSIDYRSEDHLSISIFRKTDVDGEQKMCRIAVQSTNPDWISENPRRWRLGRGYTGVCWNRAANGAKGEVIIPDTQTEDVKNDYPVDEPNEERDGQYRSIASIPILIGEDDSVWGVVTATSSRVATFKRDPENDRVQNVDTIRDVARYAGILAALDSTS